MLECNPSCKRMPLESPGEYGCRMMAATGQIGVTRVANNHVNTPAKLVALTAAQVDLHHGWRCPAVNCDVSPRETSQL